MTTTEVENSIRYVVFLEEVRGNRVAKVAFPSQALYLRYLKKRGLRARDVRCSYVELAGDLLPELRACYCQWFPDGNWELSGYSADENLPSFAMEPHAHRQVVIPVADEGYLSQIEGRTQRAVNKIAKHLQHPIQALDMDLWRELRELPRVYYIALVLVVLVVFTFIHARTAVPDLVEDAPRAMWLSPALQTVSYFEGEDRFVFEAEVEPVAVQRAFTRLEVIPQDTDYTLGRYTLYRDAGSAALGEAGFHLTGAEYEEWLRQYFITVQFGYAARSPNGSVLAYNLVTKRLYGNLINREDLNDFR